MQSLYNFTSIEINGTKSQLMITKDDLLKKYPSVEYRDLYIIDKNLRFRNSSIIAKKNIIVVKLHFIRCIIQPTSVLLIKLAENDSFNRHITLLENSLIISIKDTRRDNLFEFKVLETIFITIRDYFDDITMETLAPKMTYYYDALDGKQLVKTVKNKGFSELYKYIVTTQSTVEDIRDMLIEIADQDTDELDEFYISRNDSECDKGDEMRNEFLSDLMNTYKSHFEENTDDLNKMIKLMELIIKLTNIDLADTRNKMAQFDININILMIAITLGGLISSSFGMNVPNHYEDSKFAFIVISACIIAVIIIIYIVAKGTFYYNVKK